MMKERKIIVPKFGVNPVELFQLNNFDIKAEGPSLTMISKMAIEFADLQDRKLVEAIRAQAEKEGVTDLYVLDDKTVLAAVQKAVPMEIPARNIHVDEYYCPACGAENNCDQGEVQDDYCPRCGQRIFQKKKEEF